MTISTLHSTIQHLASQFAAGVLEAIRGASLEDILSETSTGGGGGARRSARVASFAAPARANDGGGKRKGGRLARRSAGDIASIVNDIVNLLSSKPNGLRAEEIRAELGLEAKELPRPIAEALASGKVNKRGQKRATTYFAKGAAPKAAAGGGRKVATKGAKKAKSARGGGRKGKKSANGASAGSASN